jgi:hypothetical protein
MLRRIFLAINAAAVLIVLNFFAMLGDCSDASGPTEIASEMTAIGGHWFLKPGEKPTYLYKDGERFLDLFSYHAQDSNKDGIANLKLSHDADFLIIESQGYPNHPTAIFPNSGNPNSIRVQRFNFRIPLVPKMSDSITRLPMGPVGMALNGVVFFNPFEQEGMNAVEGYTEVWLDSCCGHPQQTGVYHYHKYPSCVKSPFSDDGKQHSPVLGFAFDGFPVYGPYESDGLMAMDIKDGKALDACSGHKDDSRGYHYHVTPGRFPYILGGYAGVVEPSNNRGLRRTGTGPMVDNTQPGEKSKPVITSVVPGTITRGHTHSIRFQLTPENATRPRLPETNPTWAQIGPYEATKISREGNTVTAEFVIPDDASLGVWFDCHLEFKGTGFGPSTIVAKKNDVLRVAE